MAIDCLGSVRRLCRDPFEFHIHEDGSLTDGDVGRLQHALQPRRFFMRAEADQRMAELLKSHPACRKIRAEQNYGLKMFDTVLLSEDPLYFLLDSDVLFFRTFKGMWKMPKDVGAIFMQDRLEGYSLRSWQMLMSPKVRLPSRANVGAVCFRREQYDIDWLEWFLAQPRHYGKPFVIEQTAWASMGKRVGCRKYDDEQVVVMRSDKPVPSVAGHFTGATRHLLGEFQLRSLAASGLEPPVELRTIDGGNCSLKKMLMCELQQVVKKFR